MPHERYRQINSSLHTAGEFFHLPLSSIRQPHKVKVCHSLGPRLLTVQPDHPSEEDEIIYRGQVFIQGKLLRADTNQPPDRARITTPRIAAYGKVAAVWRQNG